MLGRLLFIIYMNYIFHHMFPNSGLYCADATSLVSSHNDTSILEDLTVSFGLLQIFFSLTEMKQITQSSLLMEA